MIHDCNITFYKIEQCGFYKYRAKTPVFGSQSKLLMDLANWSNGAELAHTKTFTPKEGNALPIYLADIKEHKGTWLVTLWNETHEADEKVPSLMANASVGANNVILNDVKPGSIPGFATYFWFIPDLNVLATVRFARTYTGPNAMQMYMRSFLRYFSSYTVRDDNEVNDDGSLKIIGYRDGKNGDVLRLFPRFKASLYAKAGEYDVILNNAERIYRICKKEILNLSTRPELAIWQKALAFARVSPKRNRTITSAKLEHSIDVELDRKSVQAIIQNWQEEGGAESGSDYGFYVHGDSKHYWLSHSLAKGQFQLDLGAENIELINNNILLNQLLLQYNPITSIINA